MYIGIFLCALWGNWSLFFSLSTWVRSSFAWKITVTKLRFTKQLLNKPKHNIVMKWLRPKKRSWAQRYCSRISKSVQQFQYIFIPRAAALGLNGEPAIPYFTPSAQDAISAVPLSAGTLQALHTVSRTWLRGEISSSHFKQNYRYGIPCFCALSG